MNDAEKLPKQIAYYSDESISEMLLGHLLTPLGLRLQRADELQSFFEQWHNKGAFLNILDITHLADLQAKHPNNQNQDLAPLWLLLDQNSFRDWSTIRPLADDFILKPLAPDHFNSAYLFWTESLPLYQSSALEKLAKMGGEELVLKILISFNESIKQAHSQAIQCLTDNDLVNAAKACHAIKPSAKMVGAEALYNLCLWMEFKKRSDSIITEKFLRQFRQIFEKSIAFFAALSTEPIHQILSKR